MRRIFTPLVLLVMSALVLVSGSALADAPVTYEKDRPKVALVLSGGGARGFAHVGVIKVLEDLGIKVDLVTGTSMGSMVGGGYASGYSVDQMSEIILGVDWREMFAIRPDRSSLNRLRREDDYKNLAIKEVGITDKGLAFPDSVVPSQHLTTFLAKITEHVRSVNDLKQLPIPFGAIATDLSDGSLVVMRDDVNLATAMRASMSVPGAFSPYPYKDHLLVDGGLVQNLPVELAKEMGADIIIAVDVSTPLEKKRQVSSVTAVMGQMIAILTDRNLVESKKKLGPKDILITVDLGELTAADFDKAQAIMDAGEKSARKYEKALKRLAVSKKEFQTWNLARQSIVSEPRDMTIAEVRVEGLKTVNPDFVKEIVDIKPGDKVNVATLNRASDRVWATDDFSVVPFVFEPGPNGTEVLVIEPQEKPWGYNTLRVGGKLSSDFNREHTFDFLLAHTLGWVNQWGGEWRNELQIGETSYFSSMFYQPLGVNSPFFVQPKLYYETQSYDLYNGHGHALGTIENSVFEGSFALGTELSRNAAFSVGAGYAHLKTKPTVGTVPNWERFDTTAPFVEFNFRYDNLDDVNFPKKGAFVDFKARRYMHVDESPEKPEVSDYYLSAILPYDWGNDYVSILAARAGSSTIPGRFAIGGLFNMSGAYYGRYTGADMFTTSLIGMKRINRSGFWGVPVYVGASIEAAHLNQESGNSKFINSDWDSWKKAGSVFVAADSIVGPLYLAVGQTSDQDTAVYFFWGRPFR